MDRRSRRPVQSAERHLQPRCETRGGCRQGADISACFVFRDRYGPDSAGGLLNRLSGRLRIGLQVILKQISPYLRHFVLVSGLSRTRARPDQARLLDVAGRLVTGRAPQENGSGWKMRAGCCRCHAPWAIKQVSVSLSSS